MSGADKASGVSKPPRELACSRCRRRKKRCNKVRPVCGECQKAGAECLSVGTHKAGRFATVPAVYLESLETRLAELEAELHPGSGASSASSVSSQPHHSSARPGQHQRQQSTAISTYGQSQAPISPPGSQPGSELLTLDPQFSSFGTATKDLGLGFVQASPIPQSQSMPSPARRTTNNNRSNLYTESNSHIDGDTDIFASLVVEDHSPFIVEYYANVYFTNVHLPWPCLDKAAWVGWYKTWNSREESEIPEEERWKSFFLDIVYSIGALYCSAFDKASPHRLRARHYYKKAMRGHQHAMRQPNAMLWARASLMLTLFTLHGPSAGDLYSRVTTAMWHCTQAMEQTENDERELSDREKSTNNLTYMSCHNLNEIITQGWERPASFRYESVERNFYSKLDKTVVLPSNPNNHAETDECYNTKAFDHVYRLRRLRSQARHAKANRSALDDFQNQKIRMGLRIALDEWKAQIPDCADPKVHSEYYGDQWMSHLYDYALIDLLHAPRHNLTIDDLKELLTAAAKALQAFIACREEKQITCYTWTALVYQFRAGIILIYSLWALPSNLHHTTSQMYQKIAHPAVYACAKTLTQFAMRWDDAVIYRDAFNFLARTMIPQSPLYVQTPGTQHRAAAKALVRELRRLHTHMPVLQMIEEMCFGQTQQPQPQAARRESMAITSPVTYSDISSPSLTSTMASSMDALQQYHHGSITSNSIGSMPDPTAMAFPSETTAFDLYMQHQHQQSQPQDHQQQKSTFQPSSEFDPDALASFLNVDTNLTTETPFQDMLGMEMDVRDLDQEFLLSGELDMGVDGTANVEARTEIEV